MYEPAGQRIPHLALLWPAFAAASASDLAAVFARHFANLAIGPDGAPAKEPQWATPHTVALKLAAVQLRDFTTGAGRSPALICAPFALHCAALSDLVAGHSLVATLRDAGLARLYVTDWRSATAETRYRGIDDYLADLNVLVDHIGPPVDLIGLCQGGWMALVYAARFPNKVRKLVLAAAPIDIAAGTSNLSAVAAANPLATFREIVRLGGGLVPGGKVLKFWCPELVTAEEIRDLLQATARTDSPAFARLEAAFRDWYAFTLDLPGTFFLEVVERLYKNNELPAGGFVALGQRVDLAQVRTPIYFLAAREDELVAPAQLFAAEHLVGTPPRELRKTTVPGRHLGLFMGRRVLHDVWPGIVRWLAQPTLQSSAVARTAEQVEAQNGASYR